MAGSQKKYNACIRKLASHLKEAKREGGMNEKKRQSLPFIIEKSPYAKDSNPWFYEAIFMSDEVDPTFRLRESVTVEGMGIPLAGLAPQGVSRPHANVLKDNGNVHTLTAILDFDRMVDGKPTLRTIPRLMNEHVFIGKNKVRQPLAANFSVPIALFWKLSDADGTELLGAFRPKKAINTMGLYFSEPYDPRKIPVVFTHGLMSGPATFANLTNRLLVDPVIRENYQFWFFGYPSGLAWTIPASRQRKALEELMQEYNPRGDSREMNNIVMVGHSMGGLITRFNNSTKPWTLMKGLFELPPETFADMTLENWKTGLEPLHCDEPMLEQLQNNFIFSRQGRHAHRVHGHPAPRLHLCGQLDRAAGPAPDRPPGGHAGGSHPHRHPQPRHVPAQSPAAEGRTHQHPPAFPELLPGQVHVGVARGPERSRPFHHRGQGQERYAPLLRRRGQVPLLPSGLERQ